MLYLDFTKAIVLVSLPLDLITLLAPMLLGSFIPDKIIHCTSSANRWTNRVHELGSPTVSPIIHSRKPR